MANLGSPRCTVDLAMSPAVPPSTNPSLIVRLSAAPHDPQTWQQFVLLYGPSLVGWGRRYGLQEADAQDVSQTVLLQISRQIQRLVYDPDRSFRGWLRAVVHGAWCDWVEQRASQKEQLFGHSNAQNNLAALEAGDDLLSRMEAQYDRELYEIALQHVQRRVEPQTWQAFQLQAIDLIPPAVVAARLGMTTAAAIAARYRVTTLLRAHVARLESAQ